MGYFFIAVAIIMFAVLVVLLMNKDKPLIQSNKFVLFTKEKEIDLKPLSEKQQRGYRNLILIISSMLFLTTLFNIIITIKLLK